MQKRIFLFLFFTVAITQTAFPMRKNDSDDSMEELQAAREQITAMGEQLAEAEEKLADMRRNRNDYNDEEIQIQKDVVHIKKRRIRYAHFAEESYLVGVDVEDGNCPTTECLKNCGCCIWKLAGLIVCSFCEGRESVNWVIESLCDNSCKED